MSKRWKRVVVGAFVVLVGIGIYFAWGASLEVEYERRVQALRDRGDFIEEPRSWSERVAPEDNAAVVFADAVDLLARLQSEEGKLSRRPESLKTVRSWPSPPSPAFPWKR